ncbi:MAG: 16S rRNA (adenine(1518)-N(6)/adenine(1519)-N(6))-dimethyltransferase RsmA [Gammaproteobacteria bacterium]|nr:16S rRNA (adenine(1518)-N(6)/adenine(1519)-N(6))-dimethyltransferase RsmA [Gammaproteobacteria bacterium]
MPVRARKRFGQHFLTDQTIIKKIIDEMDFSPPGNIVEIGPGRGALTRSLLQHMEKLHVVEIDRDLIDYLNSFENADKLIIHNVDALKFNFCDAVGKDLKIIGNLPYNISTPLLFHLLEQISCINYMLFMLQKEVADRICGSPGTKAYGRLSIMVQSMCHASPLFDVEPQAFNPPPKVRSTIIKLTPLHNQSINPDSHEIFKHLVRLAFSKRRKTIRNALKGLADDDILETSGIEPGTRPETIDVDTYIRLSNNLYNSSH